MGKEQISIHGGIRGKGFRKDQLSIVYFPLLNQAPACWEFLLCLTFSQDLTLTLVSVVLRELEAWSYHATKMLGCLSGGKGTQSRGEHPYLCTLIILPSFYLHLHLFPHPQAVGLSVLLAHSSTSVVYLSVSLLARSGNWDLLIY